MRRWIPFLLPLLGILAVDPVSFDHDAVKSLALVAGAGICVVAALLGRRLGWSSLSWAFWLFLVARAAMLLHSPMPGRAVRDLGLLAALVVAHHAACTLTTRRGLARRAPPVFAVLLALVALCALGQWLAGARQAHATLANRNMAGAAIAMLLPYALAVPRGPWLLPLGLAGLLATASRGGMLAAAAALALWFAWQRPRLRLPLLAGLPVAVLAAGLLLGGGNTVKVRLHYFRAALGMGLDHPLAGTGAGGFQREYPPVRPVEEHRISGGRRVHAVHNDYLESFAEGGLPGLGAHLLLLAAAARAARRHRNAAASLLAFAVASLVDLPLRDPALLSLAFFGLAEIAPRRRTRRGALPSGLVAIVLLAQFTAEQHAHWEADRLFGRYLAGGRRDLLGRALEIERRHPEALIERSRDDDLALLLDMEPHHAGARLNATRGLPPPQAIARLRETLLHHDPHHTLTRLRLGQLLGREDPAQAASVLEGAIDADPRPLGPYLQLARIQREAGNLDAAAYYLRRAERRPLPEELAVAWLELELAHLRAGDWVPERLAAAARRLPPAEVARFVEAALARAQGIERALPRPRIERREDESTEEHVERLRVAQDRWRADADQRTRPDYREAALLAEVLAAMDPGARSQRLLARARRGLGEQAAAARAEATASFLEALAALRDGHPEEAERCWERALLAYPRLPQEPTLPEALRLFLAAHPEAREGARQLFGEHPLLAPALDR